MPALTRLVRAGALFTASLLAANAAVAEATVQQIEGATTVAEFMDLGAAKLSAGDFKKKIVGKQMAGEGWKWIIDTDGTTSSAATDGSWKEDGAPWNMKGDKYCTPIKGKVTCRDVYMIGKYIRMSDPASSKKLANWTAKLK